MPLALRLEHQETRTGVFQGEIFPGPRIGVRHLFDVRGLPTWNDEARSLPYALYCRHRWLTTDPVFPASWHDNGDVTRFGCPSLRALYFWFSESTLRQAELGGYVLAAYRVPTGSFRVSALGTQCLFRRDHAQHLKDFRPTVINLLTLTLGESPDE